MKKKKIVSDDYGRHLTTEEREKIVDEILATTKPEDIFPESYKRFVAHIEQLEREGLIDVPRPDQHQTQP